MQNGMQVEEVIDNYHKEKNIETFKEKGPLK